MPTPQATGTRVVIVGGGFGGLACAKRLRRGPHEVTLLDRRNHHLFQPLLYQVATGGLSPANIATPLRTVFKRSPNVCVLLGQARDLDPRRQILHLQDGQLPYDWLVVAAGMRNNYFGRDAWAPHAPGLKTLSDATEIRRRILLAFERAERCDDPFERAALLRFVVIGGGPTGVELAGTLAEIARHTLRREFRRIDPHAAEVILVDALPTVLSGFPAALSASAVRQLERLGVTVRTGLRVSAIDADGVGLVGVNSFQRIETRTVLWGAGVRGVSLAERIAASCGHRVDRAGRIPVEPDCSLPGFPNVFIIGDLARLSGADGAPLPGIAPVAMQQGAYVADLIRRPNRPRNPFRYRDRGMMATIGRAAAVADLNGRHLTGYPAWLAWLFVHLFFLIEFQNRVLVMLQWAWNYVTWSRSSRLIVEYREQAGPDHGEAAA